MAAGGGWGPRPGTETPAGKKAGAETTAGTEPGTEKPAGTERGTEKPAGTERGTETATGTGSDGQATWIYPGVHRALPSRNQTYPGVHRAGSGSGPCPRDLHPGPSAPPLSPGPTPHVRSSVPELRLESL